MASYEVTARNYSEASENKVHSNETARRLGFKGALVPGVAVYGHLTHPLVEAYGESWLARSLNNVRLLKPAYDGDRLTVTMTEQHGVHNVTCCNSSGELLAVLNSSQPSELPAPEELDVLADKTKADERVEISWDTVVPGQLLPPWELTLTAEENAQFVSEAADDLGIYKRGFVHPHWSLSLANSVLVRQYIMPAWMHVGSEIRHRASLHTGDNITIRCATLDKWEKKGHQFIRVYVAYWRGETLTTDILHTAIFSIAA